VKLNPAWPVLWSTCMVGALGAAGYVPWRGPRKSALRVGRASVGVLFVFGGALMHVINLIDGTAYKGFADPAHFSWVRDTWRSVVPPNQTALISLLAAFELAVGLLVLSGGRRAQLGIVGALAFHACLWIFGWIETVYCIVMIPALLVLLIADRRSAAQVGHRPAVQDEPAVAA
jgi:hypothetical protein